MITFPVFFFNFNAMYVGKKIGPSLVFPHWNVSKMLNKWAIHPYKQSPKCDVSLRMTVAATTTTSFK